MVGLPPSKKVLQRRIAKKEPPAGGEEVPFLWIFAFFLTVANQEENQNLQAEITTSYIQSIPAILQLTALSGHSRRNERRCSSSGGSIGRDPESGEAI